MRSKLSVLAGGLVLIVAFGLPAGAQATVSHPGSAQTEATPATTAGLIEHGCDPIWNEGWGEYAKVDYAGDNPLTFEPKASLSYLPNFCNVQVTSVDGAFEIMDPNDPNNSSDPTEWGCLAVVTSGANEGTVADDSPSACYTQDYAWDQWYAINTGLTYHSGTLWAFENVYNDQCLTANYDGTPSAYGSCLGGTNNTVQFFIWNGSGL